MSHLVLCWFIRIQFLLIYFYQFKTIPFRGSLKHFSCQSKNCNTGHYTANAILTLFSLFDVKMGIDEGKLVPPAGCKSPQGPQQPVADD